MLSKKTIRGTRFFFFTCFTSFLSDIFMMEHYSTEMKKRNEFFLKHRYKNIGKIRQKFLKVKML